MESFIKAKIRNCINKENYKMVVYLITRINGAIKQKAAWINNKKRRINK